MSREKWSFINRGFINRCLLYTPLKSLGDWSKVALLSEVNCTPNCMGSLVDVALLAKFAVNTTFKCRRELLARLDRLKPSQKVATFLNFVNNDKHATFRWSGIEDLYPMMKVHPEAVAELLGFLSPRQFHPEGKHGTFELTFHEMDSDMKKRLAWNLPLALVSYSKVLI